MSASRLPAPGSCRPLGFGAPRFSFKLQLPESRYPMSGSGFAGREGEALLEKLGNPDSYMLKLYETRKNNLIFII